MRPVSDVAFCMCRIQLLGGAREKSVERGKRETLSGYITTLKNKQKLDVLSEGPSFPIHMGSNMSLFNHH